MSIRTCFSWNIWPISTNIWLYFTNSNAIIYITWCKIFKEIGQLDNVYYSSNDNWILMLLTLMFVLQLCNPKTKKVVDLYGLHAFYDTIALNLKPLNTFRCTEIKFLFIQKINILWVNKLCLIQRPLHIPYL